MAKKPRTPTTYELLGQRIQRVINAPRAQAEHYAVISLEPEESAEDWSRLIEELETIENVTMSRHEDGSIGLRWNPAESMS